MKVRWPHRKSELGKKTDEAQARLQFLDRMMYRLFKDHPVIPSIEYTFEFIDDYATVNDSERNYCQCVLKNLYKQAYVRYVE